MQSKFFSISSMCFLFQGFESSNFWDIWQYRLDQFKTENNNYQVMITRREVYTLPNYKQGKLLSSGIFGFFNWKVYSLDENTIWLYERTSSKEKMLCFRVNSEWNEITLLLDETESAGNAAFVWLDLIMHGVLMKKGLLSFHSALVEYDGYSFAICAESGTGKTTHARLWRDTKNALILNGDRTVCKREDNQWVAYGTPWSGTSGEQINRKAPLKAMVILERGEMNSVQRLSSVEALPYLLPHLLYPQWDRELTEIAMDKFDDLLNNVPLLLLKCRPDEESVEVLYQVLKEL